MGPTPQRAPVQGHQHLDVIIPVAAQKGIDVFLRHPPWGDLYLWLLHSEDLRRPRVLHDVLARLYLGTRPLQRGLDELLLWRSRAETPPRNLYHLEPFHDLRDLHHDVAQAS